MKHRRASDSGRGRGPIRLTNDASSLSDGIALVLFPLVGMAVAGPVGVAALITSVALPWILVTVPAGYVADHFRRSTSWRIVAVVRVVAAALLCTGLVAGSESLAVFIASAFLFGLCDVVGQVVKQALVREVFANKGWAALNADLGFGAQLFGGVVGPAAVALLAGAELWIVASIGLAAALVGLICSARIPRSSTRHRNLAFAPVMRASLVGFRTLANDVVLIVIAVLGLVSTTSWFVWQVVFASWAVAGTGAGLTASGYSLMITLMGVGGLLGAKMVRWTVKRLSGASLLVVALALWFPWFGIPAVTANTVWLGVSVFVGGLAGVAWNIASMNARLAVVSPDEAGRVTAAHRLISRAGRPLGALLGGLLLSLRVDPTWIFAVLAAVILVLVLVGYYSLRAHPA
jgi:MFS family permease